MKKKNSRGTGLTHRFALLVCGMLVAGWLLETPVFAVCGDGIVDDGTNGTEDLGEECDDTLPGQPNYGGDGCSLNCTLETKRDFVIDPRFSMAGTQLPTLQIGFSIAGTIRATTGGRSRDGLVPFVINREDLTVTKVAVPQLVCVCTDSVVDREFGPGNSGLGVLFCPEEGRPLPDFARRFGNNYLMVRDHNTNDVDPNCEQGDLEPPEPSCPNCPHHPGVCKGRLYPEFSGDLTRGSMVLWTNIVLRIMFDGGTCATDPTNPAKGPDGIPCNDDDPVGLPTDTAQTLHINPAFALTGRIEGRIHDANNVPGQEIRDGAMCGTQPCQTVAVGRPMDCDRILASRTAPIDTGVVALAFPVIDGQGTGDSVARLELVPGGTPEPTRTPRNTPVNTATPTETEIPTETATEAPTDTPTEAPTDTPTEAPTDTPTEAPTDTPTEAPTDTPTEAPTDTPRETPTRTPTVSVPTCTGDCDGDGSVAVNELITGVNIALGSANLTACSSFDTNGDGNVTVNELIRAVGNALEGCPS